MKLNKEEKEIQKLEEKKRELYHKEMIRQNRDSRSKVKIAPSNDIIIFKNINKIYNNHIQAVFNFDLSIKENEFIVLVGPSGCGKSTTLKMIAGLEEITSGDLFINGKYSNDVTSQNRNLAMVFQSYALYPNMTVYKNIAFPLTIRHEKASIIKEKVMAIAKILELDEDMLKRRPAALSGGQRQRVALARAMVKGSKLLLMDEPLSNLDAKLRVSVRSEIVSLHKKLNATTIYVTHDQTEAMTMADRIVVMDKGYIQQIGTPQEIYDKPNNLFVATFIGSPAMNIAEVTLSKKEIIFDNGEMIHLSNDKLQAIDEFYKNMIEEIKTDIINKKAELSKRIHDLSLVGYLKALDNYYKRLSKMNLRFKNNKKRLDTLNPDSEDYLSLASILEANEKEIKEYQTKKLDEIENGTYVVLSQEKLQDVCDKDSYIKIYNMELERMNDYLNKYNEIINQETKRIYFGVRPEDIILSDTETDKKNLSKPLDIHVDLAELLGHEYYLTFKIGKSIFNLKAPANEEILPDVDKKCSINMEKIHIFDSVSKRRIF